MAGCAAALKPASLRVAGLVGSDWRGRLLTEALEARGVGTDHVVRDGKVWTNTYVKPLRSGLSDLVYEDPRLDFENRAPLSDELEAEVLRALETAAAGADMLLVSDQMAFGCVTEAVRERICRMGEEGLTVVVDSRSRIGLYRRVIVKPNEQEARSAFGGPSTAPEALALTASLRT
ncbi:MAG: sugar kinase, partial [Clostridia bacterium]|nr:sugar kinase [Clostridia bacterium]